MKNLSRTVISLAVVYGFFQGNSLQRHIAVRKFLQMIRNQQIVMCMWKAGKVQVHHIYHQTMNLHQVVAGAFLFFLVDVALLSNLLFDNNFIAGFLRHPSYQYRS